MKSRLSLHLPQIRTLLLLAVSISQAATASQTLVVDDFSDEIMTSRNQPRILLDDTSIGGKSTYKSTFHEGVLDMRGKIIPARGQPGFVSIVLLLEANGAEKDLSEYQGIRLVITVLKGSISVLAASSDITNYDFHAQGITRGKGEPTEIKIPFDSMKRVWSEQTPLNLKTITSINLVASGLQPGDFDYKVDEISLY